MIDVMANTFIRECIRDLKKENKCYCYFEWQIKEITKKYKGNIQVNNKDGYYLLKAI